MYSPFLRVVALSALLLCARSVSGRELRVCADPDNLPFSNRQEQGFENNIATLIAADLQAHLSYVWQRMGRGFVREFIDKNRCDVLIGVPANFRQMLTSRAYYRSTYVFVARRDARIKPASLDDPALRAMKIGVQALDEQYVPPAEGLARRGMQNSIVPFYGVGKNANAIVRAVIHGDVDAALVWGPLAGYLASKQGETLQIFPVEPETDPPGVPYTFQIAMGVRKGNVALQQELNKILLHRKSEIERILSTYSVPQLEMPPVGKGAD
jgi:mxaJ protein